MRPIRRQRLAIVLFLLFGSALTMGVVLFALQENIDLFYEPQKIVGGEAPIAKRIRAGGMVEKGSLDFESEGLGVSFVLSDLRGSRFEIGTRNNSSGEGSSLTSLSGWWGIHLSVFLLVPQRRFVCATAHSIFGRSRNRAVNSFG